MAAEFLEPPGGRVEPASLRTKKARDLVAALIRPMAFADFVEARADEHRDVVVVDVEVQLPREPKADIQRVDQGAVGDAGDRSLGPQINRLKKHRQCDGLQHRDKVLKRITVAMPAELHLGNIT